MNHQFLETGVLQAHVVQDAAVVQDFPLKRRTDTATEGTVSEQVLQLLGRPAERAVEANGRVEIRFGDADLSALGGGQSFVTADIGPAPDQIGGHADGY